MASNVEQKADELQKQIDQLKSQEKGDTLGDLFGSYMMLPWLRAFWPLVNYNISSQYIDVSFNGLHITSVANGVAYRNRFTYVTFNGTTQYLSITDTAAIDITGNLTFGGWFYVNDKTVAQTLIAKLATSGNYSYMIDVNSNKLRLTVSSDGTATTAVASVDDVPEGEWFFAAGKFIPSTSLDIFLNNVDEQNTTSIPASIYNSTANLTIGSRSGGSTYLAGGASLAFLCAGPVPDMALNGLYDTGRVFFGV